MLNTHAHAQGHTLIETNAMHWSGNGAANYSTGFTRETSVSPIFEWREWESNHQPSSYWTTHSNHSILGPLLFSLYMLPLGSICTKQDHLYHYHRLAELSWRGTPWTGRRSITGLHRDKRDKLNE